MSYQKTDWENLPNTNTPLIASNLNNIESGIENNELNNVLLENKVDNEIGANAYSSSLTYNVGDYCIYNNTLYMCKTKITTPESFNSSKWESTSITEKLKSKYSTQEIAIGTWTNGKPLYRRVFEVGALANNGNTTVQLDSSVVPVSFSGRISNNQYILSLPVVGANPVSLYYDNRTNVKQLVIQTTSDRTSFAYNHVILEYYKTTD